jgi:hypothetical protein
MVKRKLLFLPLPLILSLLLASCTKTTNVTPTVITSTVQVWGSDISDDDYYDDEEWYSDEVDSEEEMEESTEIADDSSDSDASYYENQGVTYIAMGGTKISDAESEETTAAEE